MASLPPPRQLWRYYCDFVAQMLPQYPPARHAAVRHHSPQRLSGSVRTLHEYV